MEANSVQLPDPSDSSENESDERDLDSPRKRPRSISEKSDNEISRRSRNDWDAFVQSGARLKALAASMLEASSQNSDRLAATIAREDEEVLGSTAEAGRSMHPMDENTAKLAFEKTAECMILERVRGNENVPSNLLLSLIPML